MTTNIASANPDASEDLRDEYPLDYAQSRPNRFASRMSGTTVRRPRTGCRCGIRHVRAVLRFLRSVISALAAYRIRNATAKVRHE